MTPSTGLHRCAAATMGIAGSPAESDEIHRRWR